jgi:hypothetical protein
MLDGSQTLSEDFLTEAKCGRQQLSGKRFILLSSNTIITDIGLLDICCRGDDIGRMKDSCRNDPRSMCFLMISCHV